MEEGKHAICKNSSDDCSYRKYNMKDDRASTVRYDKNSRVRKLSSYSCVMMLADESNVSPINHPIPSQSAKLLPNILSGLILNIESYAANDE